KYLPEFVPASRIIKKIQRNLIEKFVENDMIKSLNEQLDKLVDENQNGKLSEEELDESYEMHLENLERIKRENERIRERIHAIY
ncbi:hypothetical protein ACJMK2_022528, partial [Sinanodonta woodiana]